MPKLLSAMFRTADSRLADFFCEHYALQASDGGRYLRQRREPEVATAIEIEKVAGCTETFNNATYWKIGFGLHDVTQHASLLRSRGLSVSQEAQFQDVGFVAHTQDADDNIIELLQHQFEENFKRKSADACSADDNCPTLGQITVRTSLADDTLAFYRKIGMTLLAVMPVTAYGFCLYFLAYTNETPPKPDDLEAVENREWLWQRPYCTLEVQHVRKRQIQPYEDLKDGQRGFMGMRIAVSQNEANTLFGTQDSCVVRDPNNIPIHVDVTK